MRKLTDFAAVIFDMDGLVLDTEKTYFKAWQTAAKSMGFDFTEVFLNSLSGLQYKDIERKVLASFGEDFDLKSFNELSGFFWREQIFIDGIEVKRGFEQFLNYINDCKIPYCLATNSRANNVQECLELAGIKEVFATIITRDDVIQGKPEPDIFLKAAERLNVSVRDCLVLEDSFSGIQAAAKAGAFSVFVPSTEPVDLMAIELCDFMVADLSQALFAFKSVCRDVNTV